MMPDPATYFAESFDLVDPTQTHETLAGLPARKGLVLFADRDHKPIQMLMCADIRRIARARLVRKPGTSARKADITGLCKVIYYTIQDSEFACRRLYHRLCLVFFADQYDDMVLLPHPCYVKLDRRTALPYFAVTETPAWKNNADDIFGPFITRKNAAAFAETLNKAFDLCRNPESLLAGRPENCVYLQMTTCTGPCQSPKTPDDYLNAVNEALAAAAGDHEIVCRHKEDQMRIAAEKLDYETARKLRDQIGSIKELDDPEYRRISPLRRFSWLHIDRIIAPDKSPLFCAFLITATEVIELQPFTTEQVDAFLENLPSPAPSSPNDLRQMKEHLAEICLFLHRSRRPGLWLDRSRKSRLDPKKLKFLLSKAFENPKKHKKP